MCVNETLMSCVLFTEMLNLSYNHANYQQKINYWCMSTYRLHIITGLMSLALLGLISIQAYLLWEALKLSESNFNTSVNDAMNQVVEKLSQVEVKRSMDEVSQEFQIDISQTLKEKEPSFFSQEEDKIIWHEKDTHINRHPRKIAWEVSGIGEKRSMVKRSPDSSDVFVRSQRSPSTVQVPKPGHQASAFERKATIRLHGRKTSKDSTADLYIIQGEGNQMGLTTYGDNIEVIQSQSGNAFIQKVFERTLHGISSPELDPAQHLDSIQLKHLLQESLHEQGIDLRFSFLIRTEPEDQFLFQADSLYSDSLVASSHHKVLLFPHILEPEKKSYLYTFFPDQQRFQLRSVWGMVAASAVFTGLLLVCFFLTVKTLFRQKKLSEMKNDFINNMTHELKTPVATIALATDTLENQNTKNSPENQQRYIDIIREENERIHRQVDRVLQAARLDRGELTLQVVDFEFHELLTQTLPPFLLQIEQQNGQLETDFQAVQSHIKGDRMHLRNAISNLLDNAIKYSTSAPQIRLYTQNEPGYLQIGIQDSGPGISRRDQSLVFDRFYRVSSGDLHPVKGFGLGLSYVKEVMVAHQGEVRLKSKPGEGSTFVLRLPLENSD